MSAASSHYAWTDARAAGRPSEQEVRSWVIDLAHWLDSKFTVPGTGIRFGYDAIIGLIPVVGDVAMTTFSFAIVAEAFRLGASRWTILKMVANILVEFVIGAIPLLGDLFDVYWKANLRNVELLKRDLHRKAASRNY